MVGPAVGDGVVVGTVDLVASMLDEGEIVVDVVCLGDGLRTGGATGALETLEVVFVGVVAAGVSLFWG